MGKSTRRRTRLQETRPNLLHMSEGVCIGLCLVLGYLLIELLTDQSIKIWLFCYLEFDIWEGRTLVGIMSDDITRNITPAALFLWPAAMMLRERGQNGGA